MKHFFYATFLRAILINTNKILLTCQKLLINWLFLKHGFSRCGHRFGGSYGFRGLSGFGGFNGLGGFGLFNELGRCSGFDGLGRFYGFSGFGGFSGFDGFSGPGGFGGFIF